MTTQNLSKPLGIALVIISSFFFSLQFPLRYLAEGEGIAPLQLIFLATMVASILVLPFLPWCLKNRPPWIGTITLACSRTIALAGYFQALQILPPSLAVMLFFSGPLLTVLQTTALRLEKLNLIQIFGFFVGLGGLALALDLELRLDITGILWALIGGVGLSWEYLSARVWIPANKAFSGTVISVLASNMFVIPLVWYFDDLTFPHNIFSWYPVPLLAILAFILPTMLLLKGIAHAGANTASLLSFTEPLFTISIAIVFGWDDPVLRTWLGMIMLMTALAMVAFQTSKAKATEVSKQ